MVSPRYHRAKKQVYRSVWPKVPALSPKPYLWDIFQLFGTIAHYFQVIQDWTDLLKDAWGKKSFSSIYTLALNCLKNFNWVSFWSIIHLKTSNMVADNWVCWSEDCFACRSSFISQVHFRSGMSFSILSLKSLCCCQFWALWIWSQHLRRYFYSKNKMKWLEFLPSASREFGKAVGRGQPANLWEEGWHFLPVSGVWRTVARTQVTSLVTDPEAHCPLSLPQTLLHRPALLSHRLGKREPTSMSCYHYRWKHIWCRGSMWVRPSLHFLIHKREWYLPPRVTESSADNPWGTWASWHSQARWEVVTAAEAFPEPPDMALLLRTPDRTVCLWEELQFFWHLERVPKWAFTLLGRSAWSPRLQRWFQRQL